jgi:hypothetical protein
VFTVSFELNLCRRAHCKHRATDVVTRVPRMKLHAAATAVCRSEALSSGTTCHALRV